MLVRIISSLGASTPCRLYITHLNLLVISFAAEFDHAQRRFKDLRIDSHMHSSRKPLSLHTCLVWYQTGIIADTRFIKNLIANQLTNKQGN